MPARVYGVLSLVTFAGAVAIAVWAGWRESPALGVGYAALALVSLLVIVAVFCGKCAARDRCGHVVFGPIARLIRKELKVSPYTSLELTLTSVLLALTFVLPLGWLWRYPLALGVYALFLVLGAIDVGARVCPACNNAACPLSKASS